MTQTSPLAAIGLPPKQAINPEAQLDYRTRAGRVVAGCEVRAVAPDGEILPDDGESVGEFEKRGPWVARHPRCRTAGGTERFRGLHLRSSGRYLVIRHMSERGDWWYSRGGRTAATAVRIAGAVMTGFAYPWPHRMSLS